MRRRALLGLGAMLFSVPALVAAPGVARADDQAWDRFKGQVVFSDVLLAPSSQFPSGQVMVAALKRLERTSVDGRDGFWRLHFVAFLDRPSDSGALRIVATDVTDAKKRREVKVFEVTRPSGERELHMNDFVLTDAMGFEHGHRYEIAVTPGGDEEHVGKEDVYARGVVTLR
jgi:hypothetical protein